MAHSWRSEVKQELREVYELNTLGALDGAQHVRVMQQKTVT